MLLESIIGTLLGGLSTHVLQKRRDLANFDRTEGAALRREARAQRFQTALAADSALRQHRLAAERDRANAERLRADNEHLEYVRFALAETQLRRDRALADGPLSYDPDVVTGYIRAAGEDGAAPVLLFAPITGEAETEDSTSFRVGLRRGWRRLPWSADVRSLDGVFKRPLTRPDIDLLVFRDTVPDVPLILVHGEAQTASRLWISIVAWGMLGEGEDSRIEFNLPPIAVPADDPDALLDLQDRLGRAVGVLCGAVAEWHQLIAHGTPPRIHRLIDDPEERRWVGVTAATGYELAAARGACSGTQAAFWQSVILAESGLAEAAAANIDDATLRLIAAATAADTATVSGMRALAAAFASTGDAERAAAVEAMIETAALHALTEGPSALRTW